MDGKKPWCVDVERVEERRPDLKPTAGNGTACVVEAAR